MIQLLPSSSLRASGLMSIPKYCCSVQIPSLMVLCLLSVLKLHYILGLMSHTSSSASSSTAVTKQYLWSLGMLRQVLSLRVSGRSRLSATIVAGLGT